MKKPSPTPYLTIDIGNTRAKVAIFARHEAQPYKVWVYTELNKKKLNRIVSLYQPEAAIVSSVSRRRPKLLNWLQKRLKTLINLNPDTPLPIKNDYLSPKTLGKDRLANAVAAWAEGEKNISTLIIDAGTCIKYDFLQSNHSYTGGAISLGLQMRAQALQHFTARLPLIAPYTPTHEQGRNTVEAINMGVVRGLAAEINAFYQHYQAMANDKIKVILTGGDIIFLQKWANFPNVSEPNLVLKGLYQILKYNVENYQ